MGVWKFGGGKAVVSGNVTAAWCLVALLAAAGTGCQQTSHVVHRRLIEHQAMIDFSGLKPAELVENVNVRAAIPRNWETLEPQSNALYTHQQWKSPSTKTGVGVAHLRLPIPINVGLLKWIAKREYTKKGNDGRIVAEWTDDLGRPWFEAENEKYRVRGYIVCSGFQAWVIYFGHKAKIPPDPAELSLAARSADSIVPNLTRNNGKSTDIQTPAPERIAQR
jgi:hypothetical protein